MSQLIDARGLGCAEPVILAKKGLDLHDEITIIVDQPRQPLKTSRPWDTHTGCSVDITGEGEVLVRCAWASKGNQHMCPALAHRSTISQ